ncbi:MAG: hypothetical protein EOP83_23915 [Verrucomicrobiaceae bacterium]|nr:MAG: hypothetical protein EOP83_23915 [Verrucomicrobiaceae bacterium]
MLKPKWDAIIASRRTDIKKSRTQELDLAPLNLFVNKGRNKGKIGEMKTFTDTAADIFFEDGSREKIGFARLDPLDHEGNPVTLHMKDMLGADITKGALVCYSMSKGQSSHALEIGRVIDVAKGGSLMVRPMVRNSEKAQANLRYDYNRRREVEAPRKVDSTRCLLIPVDTNRLMMCMMTDFDNLGTDFNG